MQKLLLCFTVFILSLVSSSAQQAANHAIRLMPYQASGFLVLDHLNNPTVTRWEVNVQQKVRNTSYKTVQTYNLNSKHYVKLPANYHSTNSNQEYYLGVKGYDANNNVIVQEGPRLSFGDSWYQDCSWICEGSDYAYSLSLYANPSNSLARLYLESAYETYNPDAGISIPYYEYMTAADLNTKHITGMAGYYNLPALIYGTPGTSTSIIRLLDVGVGSSPVLYDASGYPLTGVVYGVQKFTGPWAGSIIQSPDVTGGNSHCGQTFGWALTLINSSSDFGSRPPAACNNVGYPGSASGQGTSTTGPQFPMIDCFHNLIEADITDPFEIIEFMKDCLEGSSGIATTNIFPSEVTAITFQPCSPTNNGGPITFTENDFVGPNGNFISPTLTLPAGLNAVNFQLTNNKIVTFYYELTNGFNGQMKQSNLVDATIYQVPIVGNQFNIDLVSDAQLSFQYELFDFSGNSLYQQHFNMTSGQQMTATIAPNRGIPSGQLVNKFTFGDGSIITQLTSK